jgi:DNA-binding CsgD family transcriptional regulator
MKLTEYILHRYHFGKKYDVEKILDMVKSGQSDDEIADILGCHPLTVAKYRIENGLKRKPGGKPKINHDKAFELYRSGKSDREISIFFKCSQKSVSNWRMKNNLPPSWIYISQNYSFDAEVCH